MDEVARPAVRKPRQSSIRQSEIARAIRGAMQAGMEIGEVIATRDGIRILSKSSAPRAGADNSWDDVLDG